MRTGTRAARLNRPELTAELASRLVSVQFPEWAHLPIAPVELDGWDNTTFRLGEELTVRLPSADAYAPQVEKEHRWLPILATHLPVQIPQPVVKGAPAREFPRPWSVYRWLPGEHATVERVANLTRFAADLAEFLRALQQIEPAGPAAGTHNFFRGGELAVYDGEARETAFALHGEIDAHAAAEVWETALAATWSGSPVWVHGDVTASNLLVVDGRLSAVIDFGCAAVGDPACDLTITWTFFSGESREAFRERLPLDERTWARARGWALWKAQLTLVKALQGTEEDAARRFGWRLDAREVVEEVLADHAAAR
ncbi:MAG TPA: aminoglycoside phosphotransferase family protein [Gaiellaceae bacterium]|nr:aminoglycoside phosphotransferase family protein [Gaiellaceae bacterium]